MRRDPRPGREVRPVRPTRRPTDQAGLSHSSPGSWLLNSDPGPRVPDPEDCATLYPPAYRRRTSFRPERPLQPTGDPVCKAWPCLWVALLVPGIAIAAPQEPDSAADPVPPPHLSILEGAVVLDRESGSESASVNAPILDGDRVRTAEGRAEILFPDGTALHLDRHTTVDVLAPTLWRLMQGRIVVAVAGDRDPTRAVVYQIDAPPASVQTGGPGEYRLDLYDGRSGPELSLLVVSGAATLATDAGSVAARAGERVRGTAGAYPAGPEYYNSARWDEFDTWSAARRDERRGVISVRYLPQDLRPYAGTFDRYGTWRNEPEYGYVWYPAVAADWRPYWSGYWQPYPLWDAFWISADPWGWPTHHYGRWGFSVSFGWYWVPGRSWGPAWVHWAVAADYVSWCPLGYHNRPVFGLWGVTGHIYSRPIDPWRGWTVLPRHHFGRAVHVSRVALDGRRLDHGVRGTFVAQRATPATHFAVPRSRTATPRPSGAQPRALATPRTGGTVSPSPGNRGGGLAVPGSRGPATQASPSRFAGSRPSGAVQGRREFPGAPTSAGGPGPESARERAAARGMAGVAVVPGSGTAAGTQRRVFPGPFRAAGESPVTRPETRSPSRAPGASAGRQRWPNAAAAAPRGQAAPGGPSAGTPTAGGTGMPARRVPGAASSTGTTPPPRRFEAGTPTSRSPLPRYQPGPSRSAPSAGLPGRGSPAYPGAGAQGRSGPGLPSRQLSAPASRPGPVSRAPSAGAPSRRESSAPPQSAPRASTPVTRGPSAPSSRYNPGTAGPRGNATSRGSSAGRGSAPRSGQSRRPPGREP